MRQHGLERILGRTFAWTGGFSRIGQKRRQNSIESLLGRTYYWAGALSWITGQEVRLPSLVNLHFGDIDFHQGEFVGPATEERKREYQRPIIEFQEAISNLRQLSQISDPGERYAKARESLEKLQTMSFIGSKYTLDKGAIYSQLLKMREDARKYATQFFPGAINAYFRISDEISAIEESHPFFPLARSMPKGVYKGPLDVGFVARDYSKSYVPATAGIRTHMLKTLDETVRFATEGLQALEAGDFAKAAASYEGQLMFDNNPQAHYLAGVCYEHLGQHKKAKSHLKLAMDYDIDGTVTADAKIGLKETKTWQRKGRMFGWIGRTVRKVADAVYSVDERLMRGEAALRQGYATP